MHLGITNCVTHRSQSRWMAWQTKFANWNSFNVKTSEQVLWMVKKHTRNSMGKKLDLANLLWVFSDGVRWNNRTAVTTESEMQDFYIWTMDWTCGLKELEGVSREQQGLRASCRAMMSCVSVHNWFDLLHQNHSRACSRVLALSFWGSQIWLFICARTKYRAVEQMNCTIAKQESWLLGMVKNSTIFYLSTDKTTQ